MKSVVLRFYVHENRKVHSLLAYEWLLEHAKKMGIHGGSAFRAIAGFGRHGILHEQHFFELAGDLTVVTEFIVSHAEADALLEIIKNEKVHIVVARWEVDFLLCDGGVCVAAP
jgi:PII-like signaling protein